MHYRAVHNAFKDCTLKLTLQLRIQGLAESQEGTTDDKVLHLINTEMSFEPPLVLEDIERSHRLGPSQDREGRPRVRPVIVRFRTERLRDSVYRARTRLKEHNKTIETLCSSTKTSPSGVRRWRTRPGS